MITIFTSYTAEEIDEIKEKFATEWVDFVSFSDVVWLTSDFRACDE